MEETALTVESHVELVKTSLTSKFFSQKKVTCRIGYKIFYAKRHIVLSDDARKLGNFEPLI